MRCANDNCVAVKSDRRSEQITGSRDGLGEFRPLEPPFQLLVNISVSAPGMIGSSYEHRAGVNCQGRTEMRARFRVAGGDDIKKIPLASSEKVLEHHTTFASAGVSEWTADHRARSFK